MGYYGYGYSEVDEYNRQAEEEMFNEAIRSEVPATRKQISYLKSLIAKNPAGAAKLGITQAMVGGLSKSVASETISKLVNL